MKRVRLVKLKHEDIEVHDFEDRTVLPVDSRINQIIGSHEYVPERFYQENVDIRRVIDHGHEHYIAVNREVWEYLYCLDNPVTAKTQEVKIESLTKSSQSWENEAWRTAESYKKFREATFSASLLKRIKWVFTGVKL